MKPRPPRRERCGQTALTWGNRAFSKALWGGTMWKGESDATCLRAWVRSGARFQEPALGYRYPICWALAKASVRFRAPSLTMAEDR